MVIRMKTPRLQSILAVFCICAALLTACNRAGGTLENSAAESGSQFAAETEYSTETKSIQSETVQSKSEQSESDQSESSQPDPVEEERLAEQKEQYTFYINELDRMLSESREQEANNDIYQESISSIFLFSQSYSGGLQADYSGRGINSFQIVILNDETEEKQRYECHLLQDGSLWFTYQTESKCENDMPDYIVNEDVLRYGRADSVYDDGMTDLEEEKKRRSQGVERYITGKAGGEAQELWNIGDRVYRIERDEEIFVDVTAEQERCIADFLWEQSKRISCQLVVSEDSLAVVEKYKPEGYSLLWEKNAWSNIAVCDLNHDERMDYVVALYPDDYEEVNKYEGFSPYEKSPQYYAACFWLLLSSEEDGYETIGLSNSIEYWEDALGLVEIVFVEEGVLQLEYFVGRSPFTNAQLRFQYDEEDKNFYMLCSYYRNGFGDALLIGDTENYGRTSMLSYFAWPQHYCEGNWQSVDDVPMQNGTMIGYYSDSFQYRCENLLEEHHINSLIWEKEYELLRTLEQYYPQNTLDVHMVTTPVFYNSRLVSGQVEVYGYEKHDKIWLPIMVDKQNGKYVTVTELLQKEAFLQIFADWSKDALLYERITPEEKARCGEAIEKNWGRADIVENYLGEKSEILFLQMVQEGVRIGVWSKTDEWMEYYIIEKEYFWGTEVWDYLNPYC